MHAEHICIIRTYIHTWLAAHTIDKYVNTNSTNSLWLRAQPLPSLLEKNGGHWWEYLYTCMYRWAHVCVFSVCVHTRVQTHQLYLYTYTCDIHVKYGVHVMCHMLNLMCQIWCKSHRLRHTQIMSHMHVLYHICHTHCAMHVVSHRCHMLRMTSDIYVTCNTTEHGYRTKVLWQSPKLVPE